MYPTTVDLIENRRHNKKKLLDEIKTLIGKFSKKWT